MAVEETIGTGRRKTSVASVRLRSGSGKIDINGRSIEQYFPTEVQRHDALKPLAKLDLQGKYDMIIRVKGGGIQGQVEAVSLGLARALVDEVEERRADLKHEGLLTRDDRRKERKKYGQPGARKKFQFSKR